MLSFRTLERHQYPRQTPVSGESDYRFSIREVGKLTTEPYVDYLNRSESGNELRPAVYILLIKMVPGKTAHFHSRIDETESDMELGEVYVLFLDEDLSQRVAKALVHAVELCGGGDKDPFK